MNGFVNALLLMVMALNASVGLMLWQLYEYLKANPWRVTFWAERLRRFLAQ